MSIRFIDLQSQFQRLEGQIRKRIDQVLAHGQFIMGPEVLELESSLAQYCGVSDCVACSSGTDALYMSLLAFNIGPGDIVFTTPFTFMASAEVIALCGAIPVFVDIDSRSFNIDPDKLRTACQAVKTRDPDIHPLPPFMVHEDRGLVPKGIIAVNLFGQPADYEEINELASSEGLFVIEDAAQSFGGIYKGRQSCSLADTGCTSFFPAKPLGGYGDGGAVLTDNQSLAQELRSIRVHGQGSFKYENRRIGMNGRLDTLQAAVLLSKLEAFPRELERRGEIAAEYSRRLEPLSSWISVPRVSPEKRSAWAQYSILAKRRDELQGWLSEQGIPSNIYYERPLHLQPAFDWLGHQEGDFPVAEAVGKRVLSLPMHPYLSPEEISEVTESIRSFFEA